MSKGQETGQNPGNGVCEETGRKEAGCEKAAVSEKTLLRKQIRRLRRELPEEEKQSMDRAIFKQLTADSFGLKKQNAVYLYISFGKEVDTRRLLSWLWENHIPVAVPRVEDGEIHFYFVNSWKDVSPGTMDILEPVDTCKEAKLCDALVITPGLAFTLQGDRMGYGGGYYDRFFAREPEHRRIALAYPFQVLEHLPAAETDQKIDELVSSDRTIRRIPDESK